jgi:chromosomal replication initiation ATPase DnaA
MRFVESCLQRSVPVPHIAQMLNRSPAAVDRAVKQIEGTRTRERAETGDTAPFDATVVLSLFRGLIKRKPTMQAILEEVAGKWGLEPRDLIGVSRQRSVAWPRQEVMYRIHETGCFSTTQIGRFLGDRDHTTILHGIRRHKARLDAADAFA